MDTQPMLPNPSEWFSWPVEKVARWLSARSQPLVVGWPFNGTRRWYASYQRENPEAKDYATVLARRQAELHRLIFAFGVRAVLSPGFSYDTLKRGEDYTRRVLGGLRRLADDEVYQSMYDAGLRLRFYGDYEHVLDTPVLRPVLDVLKELTAATASGSGPLLLMGLFADRPYPTLARLSVELASRQGSIPSREELVEAYYGLPVPDLSLFVGYGRPELFDVPLLPTGGESLYATLNPSPDVTEVQLREILYDHLVTRQTPSVNYDDLSLEAQLELERSNERYSGVTLGIGKINSLTGKWEPSLPSAETSTQSR